MRLGRTDQPAEILQRAEFGKDGVVTAFLAADRVGAADIIRLGVEAVVAALAVGVSDRMDGREIQHVESHRADARQVRDHIVESAMPSWITGR